MGSQTCRRVVYLGAKGSALALNRESGEILWKTRLVGSDFVSLMLDDDVVLAATRGELFCLDALSGELLWRNGLPGMGFGVISIATDNGSTSSAPVRAKKKKDEDAAAGASFAGVG